MDKIKHSADIVDAATKHGFDLLYILETPRAGELVKSDIADVIEPDDEGWPLPRFAIIVNSENDYDKAYEIFVSYSDVNVFDKERCTTLEGFLAELETMDGYKIIWQKTAS